MAITSYTVPPSPGVNTTSTRSDSTKRCTEYPAAGVAASSTAELGKRVSTTLPPTLEYSRRTPAGVVEACVAGVGVTVACVTVVRAGAGGGADDALDAAALGLEPLRRGVVTAGGSVVASAEPSPVVAACSGHAATGATRGPSVATGSTASSPVHTTAIAVAVAATQARVANTARLGTVAALQSSLVPGVGGVVPHWRVPVNPLGCHTMARVLLVEDDPDIRSTVIRQLSEFGHSVRSAGTALAALREATKDPGDVIVLDLGLPDLDGSEALKMLRAVTRIPVIIATARDDEAEIIRLLHAGADDYLVKPYSAAHLAARIAAVLRRAGGGAQPSVLKVGGLEIDPRRRQAQLDGQRLDLSRREFDLLASLAARPGEVVTRRELLSEVWQLPYGDDQTIDVHLSWLRRKLGERASRPRYLHTVRGVGVRLMEPAVDEASP